MNIPKREEGQGLVEYALILALIAVVVIVILTLLGSQVVLVFARAAGGLQGDVLDAANGDTAVIVGYDDNISGSGGSCSGQLSNIQFVGVDANGQIITDGSVSATLVVNGIPSGTISGNAGSSGLVTAGQSPTVSGSCPLQITAE